LRIRRLLLKDFGRLHGEYHFAADRVNLILEPNESGKSTLVAAIVAGLYGFPAGQRRSENRPVPEVEVHRPWSGAEYSVELDVEADGRVYTVRRNFSRKEERVYEWRTGKEITGEFMAGKENLDFGGSLTGLDREDFIRSVFLKQAEMDDLRNASGLTASLQKIATSQQGDIAASEAIEILRAATRQYRGRKIRRGKIENEIHQIDEEISSLTDGLRGMEERRRAAENRIRELENVAGEEGRVDFDLHHLEYLVLAAGRKEDAAGLEEEQRERADLEEREKEFQALSADADFPTEGLPRLLEIRGRLQELSREEERIRERADDEIERPIRELEERIAADGALSSLAAGDLSRFSVAETDLAASWKSRRSLRRSLRSLESGWTKGGVDPRRMQRLSERFGGLKPDDRRFLLACGEKQVSALGAISELEREKEGIASEMAGVVERGRRSRMAGNVLAIAAAALGLAAVVVFLSTYSNLWGFLAAGGAVAAIVIRAVIQPGSEAEAKLAALRAEEESTATMLQERRGETETLRGRLEVLAGLSGHSSGEAFLVEYREAEAHQEEMAEQSSLMRRLAEAEEMVKTASASILAVMTAAGHPPRFGVVTPRTARRFRTIAASHRESASRLEELRERRRGPEKQAAGLAGERESLGSDVRAILRGARLAETDDLDEAIRLFEEGIARKERYETLKRDVIPALVRRSMTHRGESLRRAVEVADGVLRKRVAEDPSLSTLVPVKSHKEYAEERSRLQHHSRSLSERRMELSAELGEVLREFRKEYPDAVRWQREWQEQRERASSFKAAVDLACEVLDTLSREAYSEWADVLNERAGEVLSFVAPGYGDVRFDEDLSFTIRDVSDGGRRSPDDIDHRLSVGARDQIYLAARLSMAEYLSSGRVKLPLVLDEPFSSFDDDRFARAMSLLLDKFGKRHQVILLSCHEIRHRVWQEREPERFAEKVRVMSLQAPVT